MLDIKFICENPELVKNSLAKKGYDVDFTEILKIDAEKKKLMAEIEALKAERNRVSAEIPKLKKEGKPVDEIFAKMREIGDTISQGDAKINEYAVLIFTMVVNFVTEFLYQRFFVFKNSIDTNALANKQRVAEQSLPKNENCDNDDAKFADSEQ